jgi:DNA-binding NtrC family response regulator
MSESSESPKPTILFVDDEPGLADLYEAWLADEYDTKTAYSGQEALELIDETIDIVFLDRRMPDLCGDEVLAEVREQGYDCYVTMVTGVNPDFDIIEMDFDDYLVKSVSRSDLKEAVERAVARTEYDQQMRELFRLAEKRAALESEKTVEVLQNNSEYQKLVEQIEQLDQETADTTANLDNEDFRAILAGIRG